MWLSPVHVFRSSNRQDPSDCEINGASDIETSKTLESPTETSKQSFSILNPSTCSSSDLVSLRFDHNSSDLHGPSGCEVKEPDAEAPDHSHNDK